MNGRIVKARYIADIPDEYLKKGEVYVCREIQLPGWLGYTDNKGDHYAVPADRFETVDGREFPPPSYRIIE